jgi:hypothetical protein
MSSSTSNNQYEVLSPWAEADPVPLRGISPRLTDLTGKKIGLFRNFKRAAKPMLTVVEKKLKERYPTSEVSWFDSTAINVLETETENKAKFKEWVNGIDAAITSYGD